MLKAFVEAISQLTTMGIEPKVVRDTCDPRKAYLCNQGVLTELTVAPPLHNSLVTTLESLYLAVERFGKAEASVWHSTTEVVAVLDDVDRLERVRIILQLSDQFQSLQKLPRSFSQRDLILFLKRNLAGAIDDGLIGIFRQIDFCKRETDGATLKHGEESLGRSVHAAVANALDIPEFITATVRVYSNQDLQYRVPVRLSVDIDITRGTFELTPLPDELENAVLATQAELHEQLEQGLEGTSAAVFAGRPNFLD